MIVDDYLESRWELDMDALTTRNGLVEQKGRKVAWNPDRIVITTNLSPDDIPIWLMRRIGQIIRCERSPSLTSMLAKAHL